MTKFAKTIIFILVTYFFCPTISAQDIFDKLSRKMCNCVEKEKVQSTEEMGPCFENILAKNLNEIKDYYKVQSISEIDMEELGSKVGVRMVKNCDYALSTFSNQEKSKRKEVLKQENLTCADLKTGDFYYLNGKSPTKIPDTTFVTISNNMFLERMNNGRTYSLLNIDWQDGCKFELEFKESNDPFKKELSNPGDKYQYEILTNGIKSVILKVLWKKEEFQFELFKIK